MPSEQKDPKSPAPELLKGTTLEPTTSPATAKTGSVIDAKRTSPPPNAGPEEKSSDVEEKKVNFSSNNGKSGDNDDDDDDDDDAVQEDQMQLLVQHSPKSGWRAKLRHYLFPRTENRMRRAAGQPLLNAQKTILIDWFDAVILVLILGNTVMLALQEPLYPDSSLMVTLRVLNDVFSFLYAIEFVIRLIAFGFILFRSDWWNIFDFIIVFFGITIALVDIFGVKQLNINAIRTVIVFRPLRSIRYIDTARITIRATVRAIRSIGDVALLFVLFVLLFSVSGVSQYNGRLRFRCLNNDYFSPNVTGNPDFANFTTPDFIRWQAYDQYLLSLQIREWEGIMWMYECKQLFLQNGSAAMNVPNGISFTTPPSDLDPLSFIYSSNCSVFLPNITSNNSILSLPPIMQNERLGALNKSILGPENWQVAEWLDQSCDPTDSIFLHGFRCPFGYSCISYKNPYFSKTGFDNLAKALLTDFTIVSMQTWFDFMYRMMDAVDVTACIYFVTLVVVGAFFFVNLIVVLLTVEFNSCVIEERKKLKEKLKDEIGGLKMLGQVLREKFQPKVSAGDGDLVAAAAASSNADGGKNSAKKKKSDDDLLLLDDDDDEELQAIDPTTGLLLSPADAQKAKNKADPKKKSEIAAIRKRMYDSLKSPLGMLVTNSAIIGNIVVMGMSYYGMSPAYAAALEDANLGFIIFFTVELVFRLICTDIWVFVTNAMSVLDIGIVIVSWLDVALSSFQAPIVRGIRAIRLLNIFKPFPNMYKWIKIIVRSLKSASVLFLICCFATFVFACMGMTFFGGAVCNTYYSDERPNNNVWFCPNRPRSNYDTFVQAMITTFIMMTGDNWQDIMFATMRGAGDAAALYFILTYICLNMLLSNLLIGLLMAVRTQSDAEDRQEEIESQLRKEQARNEGRLDIVAIEEERERQRNRKLQLLSIVFDDDEEATEHVGVRRYQYTTNEMWLQSMVESTIWRSTIVIILFINSICLSLQSPISAPNSPYRTLLNIMDIFTNALFSIEIIVCIVAYGFMSHKETYLRRDRWNLFDFSIMILFILTETLDVFTANNSLTALKNFAKALRGVRPLRLISRSAGLKSVINSLANSLEALGNLFLVMLIIMTLYGIMGVQVFQGSFYSCSTNFTAVGPDDCVSQGGSWVNGDYHFDNLPQAYISLFVMSTLEGWSAIMYDGIDAVGPGQSPIVDNQRKNSLYFISFVVVGSMFFVNFFVSIIIDTYQKTNKLDPYRKARFLTPEQTAWIRSQHTFLQHIAIIDYDDPMNTEDDSGAQSEKGAGLDDDGRPKFSVWQRVRRSVRSLTRNPVFDSCVYGCILVNFLIMAVEQYPATATMTIFTDIANTFFTGLFMVEMILKLIAESPKGYLSSKWNRFDAIIVSLSVLAVVVENVFANTTFVSTFRSLRVARLLRVLRKSRRLQSVVKKFLFALYSLNNIAAVLALVIFCYGVIGMNIFGRVKWNGVLQHRANFANIFYAVLMMLRVATGGNWGDVLNSCQAQPPYCSDQLGDCGTPVAAQLFFISFLIITMFLLLNVFVAVILEVFTTLIDDVLTLSDYDCAQFMKLWLHFDPERTYRMESRFLLTLLRYIPPECVVGMGNLPNRRRLQYEYVFVESLGLMEYHGKIELQDLITSLCQAAFARKSNQLRRIRSDNNDDDDDDDDDDRNQVVLLPEERRRRLLAKTNQHFRRTRRDRYKPHGGEFDVAFRVAAQIFEAYWERRKVVRHHMEEVRNRVKLREYELHSLVKRIEEDPVMKMQSKETKAISAKKSSTKIVATPATIISAAASPVVRASGDEAGSGPQRNDTSPTAAGNASTDPYQSLLLSKRAADAADESRMLYSVAPLQTGLSSQFRIRTRQDGTGNPLDAHGLDIFSALVEEEHALARRRAAEGSQSPSSSPHRSGGDPARSSSGAASASTAMTQRIVSLMRSEGVAPPSADDTVTLARMVLAAQMVEQARIDDMHSIITCSLPEETSEREWIEEVERVERGPLVVRGMQLAELFIKENERYL